MRSPFIFLFLLSFASAVNPGFRTEVTQKGLDYVRQVGIPILEQKLQSIDIPKITGEADSPIGEVSYYVENMVGTKLSIPSSALEIVATVGLDVTAKEASMHLTGKWHYRRNSWPHIEGTGTFDVEISEVDISIVIDVGADSSGYPTVLPKGCAFVIGHLSIDFHGTGSWFYNLFSSIISDDVKSAVQKAVCGIANKEITDEANTALKTLPVVEKLGSFSEINFELMGNPIFNKSYLQTFHRGEFIYTPHPTPPPFEPVTLPAPTLSNHMMTFWLTEYIANTAGFVYQDANVLHVNVTQNMVPSGLPFQLTTTAFKEFLPTLYEKYPDMPLQLLLNATEPPYINATKSCIHLTAPGEITVFVVNKTSLVKAFTLGVVLHGTVNVMLRQNGTKEIICGDATYLKSDISLVHSYIGKFNVMRLEAAVDALCVLGVIPYLNANYGTPGFAIPSVDGISFVNPVLTKGERYVRIDTDFKYDSSKLLKKSRDFVMLGDVGSVESVRKMLQEI